MTLGQTSKVRSKTGTKATHDQRAQTSASVSTSQLVDQKQSQELAQTLVHGSISCITYLRDLFPDNCFKEQVYEVCDKHTTYKDYASGKVQTQSTSRVGSKIRSLARGQNENVDSFLNMLENGAFDALNKKVLRAIQMNISNNADNPTHVVESYTFTFSYQSNSAGVKTLDGVKMKDPTGANTTVKNVKYALQMFIRKIITLCGTLPELPARRYLHMQLYYTEDCDRNYEPPGFAACKDTKLWFAEHEGWKKQTDDFGILDTGHHAVSLKLSHLQQNLTLEVASAQGEAANATIPSNLRYTVPISGLDDIDTLTGARLAERKVMQRIAEEIKRTALAKDISGKRVHTAPSASQTEMVVDDEQPLQGINRISLEEDRGDLVTGTQVSTQTREDRDTRRRLQNMMVQSPQAQNTEETQIIDSPVPHFNALDFVTQMPQLKLSNTKLKHLEGRHPIPARAGGKSRQDITDDGSDIIECQCGHNGEEADMVSCNFCGRWQHLVCYGYQSAEDPRVPDVHVCYNCLLKEKEGPLLNELEHLTLLRKGASVALRRGYDNDRAFSEALHCDNQTAATVAKHLRSEGFLVRTPGANTKGFRQSGKPKFHIVEDESERTRMMNAYFDPTTNIAHHFDILQALPDTLKTTQFPLPPQDTEMSEAETPILSRANVARADGPITVPDSMEEESGLMTSVESPTVMRYSLRAEKRAKPTKRKELEIEAPAQVTPISRRKGGRSALSERDPNPSSLVRASVRKHAFSTEDEEEPSTPTPAMKRVKCSRALVVNVGRSPTHSIISEVADDDDDDDNEEL